MAHAHSFEQNIGTYQTDNGLQRHRWQTNIALDIPHNAPETSSQISVGYLGDNYLDKRVDSQEYMQANYGDSERTNHSGNITYNFTWNKLNTLRVGGNTSSDGVAKSSGANIGYSRWLFSESWRVSLDVTRSWFRTPQIIYPDQDLDLVETPAKIAEYSGSFGLRQLMTPTTMVDYLFTYASTNNRPDTQIYGMEVRQYIKPWRGAFHVEAARGINVGEITTRTHYGEVKAWQFGAAYLQDFDIAQLKVAYRAYREDEVTRAYHDELILGTESWSAAVTRNFGLDQRKMTVKLGVGRYKTNTNIAANTIEVGAITRF